MKLETISINDVIIQKKIYSSKGSIDFIALEKDGEEFYRLVPEEIWNGFKGEVYRTRGHRFMNNSEIDKFTFLTYLEIASLLGNLPSKDTLLSAGFDKRQVNWYSDLAGKILDLE